MIRRHLLFYIIVLTLFIDTSLGSVNDEDSERKPFQSMLKDRFPSQKNIAQEHGNYTKTVQKVYKHHQNLNDYPQIDSYMLDPFCELSHATKNIKRYLKVEKENPIKFQLLKEFLCMKYYQYFDIINKLSYGIYHNSMLDFQILKHNQDTKFKSSKQKFGLDNCGTSLSSYIEKGHKMGLLNVCPWHWVRSSRENTFPFTIFYAECNCVNCMGKSQFDTEKFQISRCQPNYTLMPVLSKVVNTTYLNSFDSDAELWEFKLEEVPISCGCILKVKVH